MSPEKHILPDIRSLLSVLSAAIFLFSSSVLLLKLPDSKINSEFKNDYNAQMDYIDSVIGDKEFKSKEFEYTIEFKYVNEQWTLTDKNFLILLTLGYYNK